VIPDTNGDELHVNFIANIKHLTIGRTQRYANYILDILFQNDFLHLRCFNVIFKS
jgi:hypothetical protein